MSTRVILTTLNYDIPKGYLTMTNKRGKLNQHDKGELRIAVGMKGKTIFIDFGKEVAWLGLDKDTALAFADRLISWAQKI